MKETFISPSTMIVLVLVTVTYSEFCVEKKKDTIAVRVAWLLPTYNLACLQKGFVPFKGSSYVLSMSVLRVVITLLGI